MTTSASTDALVSPEDAIVPAELPPPEKHARRLWTFPLLLGLAASVAAGFCLFFAGSIYYLYLLFGGIVGAMVGWVFAWGLKHVHGVNRWGASIAVTLMLAVAYLTYSIAYYVWWNDEFFGGLVRTLSVTDYFNMLQIKAEKFVFLRFPVGPLGAAIVWSLDYLIAWYVAWGAVNLVLLWETARLAPHATARMVFHLKREGYKDDHIRQRLAERGWSRPEDQSAAFRAAAAAERLHRLGVRIFQPATRSANA